MSEPVTGYRNQTVALDFTVNGDLDGTTFNPPFLRAPRVNGDPQNLYRFVVDALGVIDIDYVIPALGLVRLGATGYRFVDTLSIYGSSPAELDAAIELVDATRGVIDTQKVFATFPGAGPGSIVFEQCGYFIPQGSSLLLRGVRGSAVSPVNVRLHFFSLDVVGQQIEAKRVCACG